MTKDSNPHQDHRKRLKKLFRERGLDRFLDHQALELLLFYAISRRDVNQTAHRLLERFGGSLDDMMNAPAEELTEICGIGEHTAEFLRLIPNLIRRYEQSRTAPGVLADTPKRAAAVLEDYFFAALDEELYALLLDGKRRVMACRYVGGRLDWPSARTLAQSASQEGAASVILAINRSGESMLTPSEEAAARRMKQALGRMGIELLDILIFDNGYAVSLAQIGLL